MDKGNSAVDKVPLGMKLGWSMGNFGSQFVYTFIGIYLMYFFTDVALIGAATAGLILMLSRVWDAFFDILIGYFSDHANTRWGQKRPFILFGSLPLGIAFYFLLQIPGLGEQGRIAYYFVMTLLVWTLYSVVNTPFNAMLPNLTLDAEERSKTVGISQVFLLIALIIVGGATKPLVGTFGDEKTGFAMTGLIYGLVVFLSFLAVFLLTRERYIAPGDARYGLGEMAGLILKNRPFMICVLIALVAYIVLTMTGTMVNYFMKYNLQNEGLVPLAFICIFGVGTVSVPLWIAFSRKFGKKAMFAAGLALYGMMFLVLFFVHGTSMSVILPVFILAGIGIAGVNIGLWSLIPDTVEYAQWKLGARTEGIQFGLYLFIIKFSSSIGAVIVGKVMSEAGYVANAVQSESSLLAIRLLISVVPFALMALAFIILMFYPITDRMHKMMCAEIEARR